MKSSFKEILKDLNWNDGFRIPIANDENKQLEKEIEEKTKKTDELLEKVNVTKNRIESIDEYLKNINVERDYNQKLLSAYISQYDAEENFYKISENEIAALTQEIHDVEKEKKITEERIKLMELEIKKLKNKSDSLKAIVALDESKCVEWDETLNCDEERQQLIEKYLKQDGKKFKELDLKRMKLVEELQHHNQTVTKIMEDITEKEIILDRTAKFYTQLLEERRLLIDRWTQSIVVLRQRDSSIQALFREIASLREVSAEKSKLLAESVEFMDNQSDCNKKLNDDIVKAERQLAVLKDKRSKMSTDNENYEIEHKIQQQRLNDLKYKSESIQSKIKSLKESNVRKQTNINECNERIEDLKNTLRNVNDDEMTIDDKLRQIKLMIDNEEKRKDSILKQTKKFQDLIHRTTTQITNLQSELKSLEFQKQGELKQIEHSSTLHSKQEKMLREKKDVVHELDLKIRNYKMQISSYNGEMDQTELEKKKEKIKELEDTLKNRKDIAKLLQSQIINLESEMKKVQTALSKDNQDLETLRNTHQNLRLMMEGNDKALKNAIKLNEERQVAENILELRVTQVEELMRNTGTKVYNLEQYNLQIHAAMRERMAEIKSLRESLNSKYKLALNECSQLRAAIADKHSQTLNYQTRYDTIIAASQIYNIDREIPTSTLYIKIQNARNKSLLQEKGDKLDATIRKTEQEIKSMENTLRVVSACNENYKMSLITDDDGDENSKQILHQQLHDELNNARDELKQKRLQHENMEKALLATQDSNKIIMDKLKQLGENNEKKQRDVTLLEKQIVDQKERISRADMRLRKLYKDIQKMCDDGNAENILLQEKDIVTRELEELNLLGLQRITEFTIRHVEAEIYVKKLLEAKNIILPDTQHIKSTLSLSVCDNSTTSSIASNSSRNREKSSVKSIHRR